MQGARSECQSNQTTPEPKAIKPPPSLPSFWISHNTGGMGQDERGLELSFCVCNVLTNFSDSTAFGKSTSERSVNRLIYPLKQP